MTFDLKVFILGSKSMQASGDHERSEILIVFVHVCLKSGSALIADGGKLDCFDCHDLCNKSTTNKRLIDEHDVPNSQRFNMTYTKREAPILVPIEHKLCSELGLDRSELHKTAIKEFWNRRQQSTLALI